MPPLLCMKIFDKRIFLKHQSVLQWNIFVQWDKNSSTENRDTPPLPLIHKIFFPTRNFLKHRMVPWRSFFGPVRRENFDKTVKLPPSFAGKFSIPQFFRNTEVFSYELSALWDKNFSTEFSDITFLCIKFCGTWNFLKHRSVPQRNFSVLCDKKCLTENVILPSLMHIFFRHSKLSHTPKCSPTKFFGTVKQKILNEKSWYPLFCLKYRNRKLS